MVNKYENSLEMCRVTFFHTLYPILANFSHPNPTLYISNHIQYPQNHQIFSAMLTVRQLSLRFSIHKISKWSNTMIEQARKYFIVL